MSEDHSRAVETLPCSLEELRTLFLFEKLSDEQLDWRHREQPRTAKRQLRQWREPPGDSERDGKHRHSAGCFSLHT